jgi:hypothetical protein
MLLYFLVPVQTNPSLFVFSTSKEMAGKAIARAAILTCGTILNGSLVRIALVTGVSDFFDKKSSGNGHFVQNLSHDLKISDFGTNVSTKCTPTAVLLITPTKSSFENAIQQISTCQQSFTSSSDAGISNRFLISYAFTANKLTRSPHRQPKQAILSDSIMSAVKHQC